jgi:hypothetical protein
MTDVQDTTFCFGNNGTEAVTLQTSNVDDSGEMVHVHILARVLVLVSPCLIHSLHDAITHTKMGLSFGVCQHPVRTSHLDTLCMQRSPALGWVTMIATTPRTASTDRWYPHLHPSVPISRSIATRSTRTAPAVTLRFVRRYTWRNGVNSKRVCRGCAHGVLLRKPCVIL